MKITDKPDDAMGFVETEKAPKPVSPEKKGLTSLDTDKDGTLSRAELVKMVEKLSVDCETLLPNKEQAKGQAQSLNEAIDLGIMDSKVITGFTPLTAEDVQHGLMNNLFNRDDCKSIK